MQVQHDFHSISVQQIMGGKRLTMSWVWKDLYSVYSPLYDGYTLYHVPSCCTMGHQYVIWAM